MGKNAGNISHGGRSIFLIIKGIVKKWKHQSSSLHRFKNLLESVIFKILYGSKPDMLIMAK